MLHASSPWVQNHHLQALHLKEPAQSLVLVQTLPTEDGGFSPKVFLQDFLQQDALPTMTSTRILELMGRNGKKGDSS